LNYLILLISRSSEKGGEIAEYGAEGAQVVRTDIGKVLATISIGGILGLLVNSENHRYLKCLMLHRSGSSEMGWKTAKYGARGAWAIGTNIWKMLASISIGRIHCSFVNSENHRYLKYLILLISGSSNMDGKIAECGAEGAWAIGIDIWKVLGNIAIDSIHVFFANCENSNYLKYSIPLILGSSEKGGEIAEYDAGGAQVVGNDIW
jgi:hypothetical protein